ncbi:MAG TPA: caspase family protein [Smithellaceae bacterium]|nr:caspase family protein [Smithellaceae bacterium]
MMKKTAFLFVVIMLFAANALAEQTQLRVKVSPVPPNLSAQAAFQEASGNYILDADETGALILTLKNSGKGDAFDVRAKIKAVGKTDGLIFDRDVAIGTIPAGQTVKKEITLTASEDIPTASISLTVDIREANGFDPDPMKVSFKTKAFEPPQLVVADMLINDHNGNGRVEPMEMVEMTVRVQNTGHGDARSVSADVQVGQNVFLAGDAQTHFDLGGIASGKFRDFKFAFYTNKRIAGGEKIPITVSLNEARPKFSAQKELALTMNAAQRRTQEFVVKADEGPAKEKIELVGGLSVDVDANIPQGRKAGKYDVAVVIGNRNYAASGSPDVEFANRDAQVMKEYLIRAMGYDPANILYAEDAALSKFNEFFGNERSHKGKLFRFVRPGESRVFIYYVGHGAPDLETQEAYFVPVDANPQDLKANGYRLQTFYDNLAKIPAKKITVVLDTCFSGNSDKGLLFKNISPTLVKVKKEYRGPQNAVLMTSGAVDQVSGWYPEKRHSLFTYYFLKGLQGDADANQDGRITVGEMDDYVREHVPYMARRLTGNEQNPVVTGNRADVLAALKK